MLEQIRVLDLTDQDGIFAGYLLAQLGAEVIAIEPVGGSGVRKLNPVDNLTGDGIWWQAYARGKQSLVLDLESESGVQELQELVAQADVVIESCNATERARIDLSYEVLSEINPAIICVAITPYGLTGPKADWPATDLTVWAASGTLNLAGDVDRAPVRTSVPQTYLHAGADAAVATLLALEIRHKTGLGQQIDVSAQQSSAQATLSAILSYPNNSTTTVRRIAGGLAAAFPIKMTWRCKDGYVAITLLFGPAFTEPNRRLLRWVHEAGHCGIEDVEEDWGARILAMGLGQDTPEDYQVLCSKIEAFTLERNQAELFEKGIERGIYIAPTLSIEGLLAERHFHERDFWAQVESQGRNYSVPGKFAKLSQAKLPDVSRAPEINAHSPINRLANRSVTRSKFATTPDSTDQPLAGLKVLDFMWVIAGPFCTRVLADYGATVVKVESSTKIEPARTSPPFKDGEQTPEHATPFADFNTGKFGVTIDPNNPVGREVILDLVRWADVVTESFSPKAMKAWGLDYETLKAVNPNLIMLSSCLMGQSGPRAMIPGYGNMAAAVTGFYELTGWADRSPAGPYLAYTDGVSPRFLLAALLAALDHKRATGEGQHIDVSQAEAAIHLLAPALHDYGLNGRIWTRDGNKDANMCPHGIYRTAGEDEWIAIVCQDEVAWDALKRMLDLPELPAFADRKDREDELNNLIEAWTATQDGPALQSKLIDAGIAAHVVQDSRMCWSDPQYKHRGHFVTVPQAVAGGMVVEASRFQLQSTPSVIQRGPPATGEHNIDVLTEILGYDEDRLADVLSSLCME